MLLQLGFAFWLSRRVATETDYLLAGRKLGPTVAVFTVFATWFGAETCIGAAAEAYSNGPSAVRAEPFGYALGIALTGLFFAAAIRRRGVMTLADLYRSRYGPGVERYAALIMVPSALLWAAAQIRALGQVLAASGSLDTDLAISIAALVVIVYTAAGGLLADAISDTVQGTVLLAGLAILAGLVIVHNGVGPLVSLPAEIMAAPPSSEPWWMTLELFAVPILGTIVAQELASRILAMRSPELARRATSGAAFLYLAAGLIPVAAGLAAVDWIGPVDDPEQVLIVLAKTYLPTVLYAIFVGALVSAILSTVDSALLVAGSLTAHNILIPLRPQLSEAQRLRFNRIAVVGFGGVAYGLALSAEGVYALVQEASSLGSSGLVVLLVGSLWVPRLGGTRSAYAALTAGLGVYLVGTHLIPIDAPYLSSLLAAVMAYALFLPWPAAELESRSA